MYGYVALVGRLGRKKSLGRPRFRLKNNIKISLREIVWGDMDWIELSQAKDQ
jgi:hypothetical protein